MLTAGKWPLSWDCFFKFPKKGCSCLQEDTDVLLQVLFNSLQLKTAGPLINYLIDRKLRTILIIN